MRVPHTLAVTALLTLGVLGASACRREAPQASAASAPETPAVEPPPPSTVTAVADVDERPFAFTAADLDAWERGMKKEIELVKASRNAPTSAAWETTTAPEAARAIGADLERYIRTRRTVDRVLETLDFQGKIPGPKELNPETASPEMKARVARDPFEELDPASAAELKKRMSRVAPIWIEYTELTAVNG